MASITPILDTLLPQVLGRRGDIERFSATRPNSPLSAITSIASVRETPGRGEPGGRATGPSEALAGSRSSRAVSAAAPDGNETPTRAAAGVRAAVSDSPGQASSARAHLSRAGETIAALMAGLADGPAKATSPAPPLVGSTGRMPTPAALALILGHQVVYSGLFYESHLGQWLEGRRPLSQLRQEPQAQRPVRPASEPSWSGSDAGAPAPSAKSAGDVDERLLPLLRQQLDMLDQPVFRWQGQAWPGVPMAWQIEREPHDDDRAEAHGEDEIRPASHRTALRLDLPSLGRVELQLSLGSGRVEVYAWAEHSHGRSMLEGDATTLAERLERAGCGHPRVQVLPAIEPSAST
ncbi:flagellar hook-length control protein FliK [Salinisphaera sp. T31B1]|uniref:flagellar hook-length control protein FliK n=1 Tax=Salinisphaera sp. T31B1 TaxID=727963 RepID=UPI00334282CA